MMADAVVHVWNNGNAGDFNSANIISTDASKATKPIVRTRGPNFTGSKEDQAGISVEGEKLRLRFLPTPARKQFIRIHLHLRHVSWHPVHSRNARRESLAGGAASSLCWRAKLPATRKAPAHDESL
jgi:hypothetical protein